MSTYPIVWLNNVCLTDDANSRWGLAPSMPPRVTNVPSIQSVRVPGRDGSLWTPQGAHPSPLFTAVVLVAGRGATMDARHEDASDIVDMLGALVSAPRVPIAYQISAAKTRYADGRITSFDIERPALDNAVVTIVLELLSPFWYEETAPTTASLKVTGNGIVSLPYDFVGTAPIIDGVFAVLGPAAAPRVTDMGSGDWFAYAGVLAPGERLRFSASTLRAVAGMGVTWTSGGVGVDSLMSFGGTGAYTPNSFRVAPYASIFGDTPDEWVASLKLTATSTSSATRLEIQARRAYR